MCLWCSHISSDITLCNVVHAAAFMVAAVLLLLLSLEEWNSHCSQETRMDTQRSFSTDWCTHHIMHWGKRLNKTVKEIPLLSLCPKNPFVSTRVILSRACTVHSPFKSVQLRNCCDSILSSFSRGAHTTPQEKEVNTATFWPVKVMPETFRPTQKRKLKSFPWIKAHVSWI